MSAEKKKLRKLLLPREFNLNGPMYFMDPSCFVLFFLRIFMSLRTLYHHSVILEGDKSKLLVGTQNKNFVSWEFL